MDELKREMAGASKATKMDVLRGLMQCVGPDGKATRDFSLRFRGGVPLDVEQAQVVRCVKWLSSEVRNG